MRIDRAKFLILAAALAPAGCVVATHGENEEDPLNASGGRGGSGGNGGDSPDAATSGSGGSEVPDGSAGTASAEAAAEDGGDPEPPADGASSSGGAAGAGGSSGSAGSGGSGGGACDDSVGDPPACDSTNVCMANDWGIADCNSALTYMKPGPAETYALCIQSCTDPYLCRDATLLGACLDSTATANCETIVAGCPSIQQADCEQYLSGLTQAGRDDMVTCAASGGVFCDLYTCSESIGYW